MKKKRPTEEASVKYVSCEKVMTSVGVAAMVLIDCIMTTDPNENYEPSQELAERLSASLEMLAAMQVEYQHLFNIMMVEVPPHLVAIKIINPLFDETEESNEDVPRWTDSDILGDIPF